MGVGNVLLQLRYGHDFALAIPSTLVEFPCLPL
jgi:hypothetical protein